MTKFALPVILLLI